MIFIKLVIRNIFAYKLRNLIIFLVIAFVSMLLFLILAFSDGEIENFRGGLLALWQPSADIVVMKNDMYEAYKRNEPWQDYVKMTIPGYMETRGKLLNFDFIRDVYQDTVNRNVSIYYNGNIFRNTGFKGMEIGNDAHIVSRLNITEGRGFRKGDRNVLMLHASTRDIYRIGPGETVTLVGKDLFGQAVAEDFTLTGYFMPKINNPNLNRLAFTDLKGHYLLSGFFEDETATINIDLKKGAPLKKSLKLLTGWSVKNNLGLKFIDYNELHPEDNEVYDTVRVIFIFVCFIVIFVISVGIMNIVSVNLYDRKKEIGTYYCIGAEKGILICLYSLEILIVNIAAAISGILLGLIIRLMINAVRFRATAPGIQLVFGGDIFKIGFSASTVLWIISGILIITLLTALTTMGSSLRVPPTAALRETEE